ncbi:hypothetical protein MKA27_19565 [[Clostridium] innocuum]|uniref:hypothetical protein n=1 Tax=Clostridium innocuum TaxID=1522 RepID=UPI000D6BE4E5|nr:hypothetical protein [[Clostridium] innocuum]MCR0315636.1 hypothetical protein [[Clostridium] innocuum]MCR0371648.1 hypothetical protein [[Clostridium] innocuum]MCR0375989.1 hypothetical protein [[Clostridium] innocuum]MCR0561779.1 hypothetical protein [[Clostridium] innocuum]MCR0604270.1 hypothetical protein [[Clostridium] innocuum]
MGHNYTGKRTNRRGKCSDVDKMNYYLHRMELDKARAVRPEAHGKKYMDWCRRSYMDPFEVESKVAYQRAYMEGDLIAGWDY